jgi:hypothetical protein
MSVIRWFLNLAHELSDEAAYERYVNRNGLPRTAHTWRTFIDERHRKKYQNAKCC